MKNAKCKMQNAKLVLLFLFSVLCFLSFVLCPLPSAFSMDLELWSLPLPSSAQLVWKDRDIEVNGIEAKITYLTSQLPYVELDAFYRKLFAQRGWELERFFPPLDGNKYEGLKYLAFIKQGKFAYVLVRDSFGGDKNEIYLVHSPKSLAICLMLGEKLFKQEMLPDSEGRDLADVPRYPSSKRRLGMFTPGEGNFFVYETENSPGEVIDFYRKQMPKQGWSQDKELDSLFLTNFTDEIKKSETIPLCFYRDDETVTIIAYTAPPELSSRGRTVITIMGSNLEELFSETKKFAEDE